MANQPLKGLSRLKAAWRNSRAGLADIWRDEEAFRLEAVLWLLSIPVAIWLTPSLFSAAVLIVSGLLVLIVEILNSAIEATIDRIGPERHELSRKAKDMGSLAVLLSTLLPITLWIAAIFEWLI